MIERVHQSLWIRAAKELPGYIGADMDRQAKLATFKLTRRAIAKGGTMPLMSWESFVAFCEQQIAEYNDRPHSSLPRIVDPNTGRRRHMTPTKRGRCTKPMASARCGSPTTRPGRCSDPRCCAPSAAANWSSSATATSPAREEFHGDQVAVGYDIHDASKVWVYDGEGRFLCTAELNGNSRDYMPASYVERARETRRGPREARPGSPRRDSRRA